MTSHIVGRTTINKSAIAQLHINIFVVVHIGLFFVTTIKIKTFPTIATNIIAMYNDTKMYVNTSPARTAVPHPSNVAFVALRILKES